MDPHLRLLVWSRPLCPSRLHLRACTGTTSDRGRSVQSRVRVGQAFPLNNITGGRTSPLLPAPLLPSGKRGRHDVAHVTGTQAAGLAALAVIMPPPATESPATEEGVGLHLIGVGRVRLLVASARLGARQAPLPQLDESLGRLHGPADRLAVAMILLRPLHGNTLVQPNHQATPLNNVSVMEAVVAFWSRCITLASLEVGSSLPLLNASVSDSKSSGPVDVVPTTPSSRTTEMSSQVVELVY